MALGMIRKYSKAFIWVVLFFIIVAFALYGTISMLGDGCKRRGQNYIATVEGEKILTSEFQDFKMRWGMFCRGFDLLIMDPSKAMEQNDMQNLNPELIESPWGKECVKLFWKFYRWGIVNDVVSDSRSDGENEDMSSKAIWQLFILYRQAQKSKIELSDEEIINKFASQKAFDLLASRMDRRNIDNGNGTAKASADAKRILLKTVREYAAINNLVRDVLSAYVVSESELEEIFHNTNDKWSFKRLTYSPDNFEPKIRAEYAKSDKAKELEEMVQKYYDEQVKIEKDALKSEYWTEPSVRIGYCLVPFHFDTIRDRIPAKELEVTEEEIKKEFETNREEYFEPIGNPIKEEPADKTKEKEAEADKAKDKNKDDAKKDPLAVEEQPVAEPEPFKPGDSEIPVPEARLKKRYLTLEEAHDRIRDKLAKAKGDKVEEEIKKQIRDAVKPKIEAARTDFLTLHREGKVRDFKTLASHAWYKDKAYAALFKTEKDIPRTLAKKELEQPMLDVAVTDFDITPSNSASDKFPWGKCTEVIAKAEQPRSLHDVLFGEMYDTWKRVTKDGAEPEKANGVISSVFESDKGMFFFYIASLKDKTQKKRSPELDIIIKNALFKEKAQEQAKDLADKALKMLKEYKGDDISAQVTNKSVDDAVLLDDAREQNKTEFTLEETKRYRTLIRMCQQKEIKAGEIFPEIVPDQEGGKEVYRIFLVSNLQKAGMMDFNTKRSEIEKKMDIGSKFAFIEGWKKSLYELVKFEEQKNEPDRPAQEEIPDF